jgi:hypothetical protein
MQCFGNHGDIMTNICKTAGNRYFNDIKAWQPPLFSILLFKLLKRKRRW